MGKTLDERVMTKTCTKCGAEKPVTDFHKKKCGKYGVDGQCKKCTAERDKEYRHKNNPKIRQKQNEWRNTHPEHVKAMAKRTTLRINHGLTPEQHKQIWISQVGCCALCSKPVVYEKICVDHNHITGKMRGFLCRTCNTGLGSFYSDEKGTELLEKAVEYIGKHNGQSA